MKQWFFVTHLALKISWLIDVGTIFTLPLFICYFDYWIRYWIKLEWTIRSLIVFEITLLTLGACPIFTNMTYHIINTRILLSSVAFSFVCSPVSFRTFLYIIRHETGSRWSNLSICNIRTCGRNRKRL